VANGEQWSFGSFTARLIELASGAAYRHPGRHQKYENCRLLATDNANGENQSAITIMAKQNQPLLLKTRYLHFPVFQTNNPQMSEGVAKIWAITLVNFTHICPGHCFRSLWPLGNEVTAF